MALGNLGDPAYVPALAKALHDPEPLVRGHAAWALGRIGGAEALRVLQEVALEEVDGLVQGEVQDALKVLNA